MVQTIFMSGYGLKNVEEYLNEKAMEEIRYDFINFFDGIYDKRKILTWSHGEEIGYAIGFNLNLPFDKALFDNREECEEYLYNALKPFLKEDIKKETVLEDIDEYYDYSYE